MSGLCLRVDVPVCSFRPFAARDYQQTYPAPPPATVLGMLMSLCGLEMTEIDRFLGVKLAIAVQAPDPAGIVLRKMRRDSNADAQKGTPGYRPEYQELLTDVVVWCLIVDVDEQPEPLSPLVLQALRDPATIDRHGAVSLGESTFVVDSVRESEPPSRCLVLCPEDQGSYAMPVWVDHRDRGRTRLKRFSLVQEVLHQGHAVAVGPGAG